MINSTKYLTQVPASQGIGPMRVDSPEATLWSENMRLKSANEYFRTILTGIAVMDVYTRPGEKPAAEVMRATAKEALEKHRTSDDQ